MSVLTQLLLIIHLKIQLYFYFPKTQVHGHYIIKPISEAYKLHTTTKKKKM